ncbi:hypothetical protein [Xanthomonas hortorum]|uniref:hypothetical protein n=1 Tax=Xanthomonas hortorum TaxID=56454 RepID=UPI002114F206|nr:hypothetical protein [Xanthomonas hortorum]UUE97013.1 hypothetical protein NDY24_13855 [Xanthomonas hortorum pv. pelargonii]UUF01098.1 hypothetical protein NDY25_14025 [Xanthomonas hortorum pv. pelargonii]
MKAYLLIVAFCVAKLIGRSVVQITHHALLATMRTDHLDWSLPAYRRGTLRGMDAA